MRLAYIISQYPAISHTFIQREILALRARGFEITAISIRQPDPRHLLTETDRAEAAATHIIVPPTIMSMFAAIFFGLFTAPRGFCRALRAARQLHRPIPYFLEALLVHRICRRKNIAHLHAHFANVAADVALLAAILGEKRHSTFSFTMHGPTEFADVAEHRLAQKTNAASFILCISDFARSQLMALLPAEAWEKLEIVHCGVDPAQFAAPRGDAPAATFNLLCVARLAPVKGHAILLEALAQLRNAGRNITLTLAGDGPLRDALERRAAALGIGGAVRFLGNVSQRDMPALYAAADVFVLSSFAEGVPVVLMEAMAARCPVIATAINGIPELIQSGVNGLLVLPGRADLLADAIAEVRQHPERAAARAARAAETIARDFNLHAIAAQLAGIFQRRLAPAARPLAAHFQVTPVTPPLAQGAA